MGCIGWLLKDAILRITVWFALVQQKLYLFVAHCFIYYLMLFNFHTYKPASSLKNPNFGHGQEFISCINEYNGHGLK